MEQLQMRIEVDDFDGHSIATDYTEEAAAKEDKLRGELAQFIGSEEHHRFSYLSRLVITDGVKYLSEKCKSFWLLDVIASYQGRKLEAKTEGFQVWKIKKIRESLAVVTCDDGNGNIAVRQEIEYTDFPLSEYKLYCTDGVILLPSEY